MERVSVAEGVCVVGGVQREMGWRAIAAYVMYTDGDWNYHKPEAMPRSPGFTASWSLVWSLTCGDARCEMRVNLTVNQTPKPKQLNTLRLTLKNTK